MATCERRREDVPSADGQSTNAHIACELASNDTRHTVEIRLICMGASHLLSVDDRTLNVPGGDDLFCL